MKMEVKHKNLQEAAKSVKKVIALNYVLEDMVKIKNHSFHLKKL